MNIVSRQWKRYRNLTYLAFASAFIVAPQFGSPAQAQQRRTASGSETQPIVNISFPSVHRVYDDLKFVFDLARDQKSYQTFKETLDQYLAGVEQDKPCGMRLVIADGGTASVLSVPVKDDASFHKFLANLWDLDVKTAPPPAHVKGTVPKDVQQKLHSLKLEQNERVLYDLGDGVLRFEDGYVQLGRTPAAVRMVRGGPAAPSDKAASMAIDIRGDISPEQRRQAFEKSKEDLLTKPRREDFKTDEAFELAKADADFQLAKIELVVADSSQLHATYTVSREKMTAQFEAEVTAVPNTPLAKVISQTGSQPDAFAGISKDNADLVANINLPIDPALGRKMKDLAAKAKAAADKRIDNSSKINADQKPDDKAFAQLVYEIATDIAGMDTFNSAVRIWSGSENKLTSLSVSRVPHGEKYRELVRKFKHSEPVQAKTKNVEIRKLVNARLEDKAPELFGAEGAVYVAIADKSIWFAAGPEAMQRLEQALEAPSAAGAASGGSSNNKAIEVHAELQSLVAAWDAIGMRIGSRSDDDEKSESKPAKSTKSPDNTEKGKSERGKSDKSEKSAGATTDKKERKEAIKSTVSDLELRKVAKESFKRGDGHFTMSVTREGEKAHVVMTSDEGILRLVGAVLSKFTKENLED